MKKNSPFFDVSSEVKKKMNWKKTVLWFGMYKGYTIQKIWEVDAQYLRWLLQNTNTLHLRKFEEDRIYEKALVEDEEQTRCAEGRARRFFGGANHINGSDRYDPNRYDWNMADWMEEPH